MRFLLLSIIALLPTYLIRFHIGFIPTTFLEILLLSTFVYWCIGKVHGRMSRRGDTLSRSHRDSSPSSEAMRSERGAMGQDPEPWQKNPYLYPILLFLLAGTISIFVAPNLRAALGLWRAYIIEPILFFFMFVDTLRPRRGQATWPTVWRDVTIALSLSALGVALPAIYQKWDPIGIPNPFWAAKETRRVTSFYGFPNALGLYLAPIVVMLTGYFFASRRGDTGGGGLTARNASEHGEVPQGAGPRAVAIIAALVSLTAIFFARSEGALAALVIVGFIAGLLASRTRLFTTVVALIFIIATFTNTPWRTYLYEQTTLRREAGPIRLMQWKETVRMLRDTSTSLGAGPDNKTPRCYGACRPLFGAGLSGYPATIAPYHTAKHIEIYQYPHNIILNFWSEMGVLGLAAFLWLIVVFCKETMQKIKRLEIRNWKLEIPAMVSMAVILIHGLVDVPYFKNDLAIFFWLLLALSMIDRKVQNALS